MDVVSLANDVFLFGWEEPELAGHSGNRRNACEWSHVYPMNPCSSAQASVGSLKPARLTETRRRPFNTTNPDRQRTCINGCDIWLLHLDDYSNDPKSPDSTTPRLARTQFELDHS